MNYFCLTDVGLKREKNQDSYCSLKNKKGDQLFLVCDGIGGGKAGEVASGEAVKHFINEFKYSDNLKNEKEAIEFLNKHISDVNKEIYELSNKYKEFNGMGTTLTGLMFINNKVLSINVGDSRVYGFADNKLFRLTNDHTLVNDMIKKGEITYEESLNHPKRHYLIKAVGVWNEIEPDIHKVRSLDNYLICSDGLHGYVDENDIKDIMNNSSLSLADKANELLKKALLNGGYDNITIIVIDNK